MEDKFTLHDLAEALVRKHHMEQADADVFVRSFCDLVIEGLRMDHYVKVKGLGTFKLVDVEGRESVNVQTGERIMLSPSRRISFTPDVALRDAVNKPFAQFETVELKDSVHFDDLEEKSQNADEEEDDENDNTEAVTPDSDITEESPMADDTSGIELSVVAEPDTSAEVHSADSELTADAVKEVSEEAESEDDQEAVPSPQPSGQAGQEAETPSAAEGEPEPSSAPAEDSRETATFQQLPSEVPASISSGNMPRIPWCLLAVLLLAGILIGGAVAYFLFGGRRYIPEEWLEKWEKTMTTVPVADSSNASVPSDSLGGIDSLQAIAAPACPDTDTLPPASLPPAGNRVMEKDASRPSSEAVFLPDTVKYCFSGTMTRHTLRPGESLVKLARHYYGNKKLWPYLATYNKTRLKNPDAVPVGTVIEVPRLVPAK